MADSPAIKIGIQIIGKVKALTQLKAAKKEAGNMNPLFDKAIIIIEQSETKTFKLGGRPKWKKSKRAKAQAGKTLRDTNKLMGSVTASADSHAIRKFGKKELVFGTNLIYAPSHQFGYPARGIPKRKFLGLYAEDIKRMKKVFGQDLNQRIEVSTAG